MYKQSFGFTSGYTSHNTYGKHGLTVTFVPRLGNSESGVHNSRPVQVSGLRTTYSALILSSAFFRGLSSLCSPRQSQNTSLSGYSILTYSTSPNEWKYNRTSTRNTPPFPSCNGFYGCVKNLHFTEMARTLMV